jgi:hypothetical protein
MTEVRTLNDAAAVRDHVIDALKRELVGPDAGHPLVQINREEALRLQDPPRFRYSCGILFPRGVTYSGSVETEKEETQGIDAATMREAMNPADAVTAEKTGEEIDVGTVGAAEDDDTDDETDASSSFLPSSMGISFLADVSGGLKIRVKWAIYRRSSGPALGGHAADDESPEYWFRIPGACEHEIAAEDTGVRRKELTCCENLTIDFMSRPRPGGRRLITVTLLNKHPTAQPINERCFFQCDLRVARQGTSRFHSYPGRPVEMQDPEERSLALLYRRRPTFAIGHGCAADWTMHGDDVNEVRTETLPVFQQSPVLPREDIPGVTLSMKRISESDQLSVTSTLRALADAYLGWIKERQGDIASLEPALRETAENHITKCFACYARITAGIALLESDEDVFTAFRMMNRAMLEQRDHYALSADDRLRRAWAKGEHGHIPERPFTRPVHSEGTRWRPFQLAFVLMNLSAFADPAADDRDMVDIIWFPTGGGKTEAYLGLAAFSMLHRRLVDPRNAGTTVLMRYTLRLLTTQQFQRAASLICALELMRRSDPARLGGSKISIGLWVGGSVTPNRHKTAVEAYERLARDGGDNPFSVLSCPWCGIEMGPRHYDSSSRIFGYRKTGSGSNSRIIFRCEDPDCDFSEEAGLPLEVVDEAIYDEPPTLLIGTVDKFAMMPWDPRARKLFGIDNAVARTPPDLIIQDELHLISGPLGSMVGHYETVIDEFCSRRENDRPIRAKIVASTATISRSEQQVQGIYGRKSSLFPPQGLVAGESFFAFESKEAVGRTYVGILPTAISSPVTAQVRLLATLLQAPALIDAPPEAVDPYWTLMVYFNSLRELGRAATLIQADIREYLNAVWDRIGLTEAMLPGQAKERRRFINNFSELTSRLKSGDIPEVLQALFVSRPSRDVVDLCYATNMIQVGLDVSRLSIMAIVGQPKGASEYIQASSRVGRDLRKPGLVICSYNPFKPRDRSHFESFRPFHENAYRHVEPTSVTPFSIPVAERAIHALAIAIARFRFPGLRDNPGAGPHQAQRDLIVGTISERVRMVAPKELERATLILNRFLDDWVRTRPTEYGTLTGDATDPLIWPAGRPLPGSLEWRRSVIRPTASSMRSVDAECEATPITQYTVENQG